MVGLGFGFGRNAAPWISWTVSLGLLTGAWAILAMAMGSHLPSSSMASTAGIVSMDGPMTVRQHTYPLWIEQKLACGAAIVSLDLLLTLEVKSKLDGEWASFSVQAWLASNEASSAPDQIAPVRAHFGFSSPQYGQAGHVYRLQAPILGQAPPANLVVPLEQGVDDHSQLIVKPGQVQLACG